MFIKTLLCLYMLQGSDKSPKKNRNEIRHSLCMPHANDKSWQNIKKMTHKTPQFGQKTSSVICLIFEL